MIFVTFRIWYQFPMDGRVDVCTGRAKLEAR